MRAILTFVLFLTITVTASANTNQEKVATSTQEVKLEITITKETSKQDTIARLYKFKNTRVKRALKFVTKAHKAKMA